MESIGLNDSRPGGARMMKAAVLRGNEDLRWEDWPAPEAGPGEVLVRVRAAGICGSDVPRVLHHGAHGYPIVLGHEFSGEVAACGEGVTGLRPGDRVAGAPLLPCMACADCAKGDFSLCRHYSFIGSRRQGAFAEYVALPEANAVKFGDSVGFELGALFEPSTVALHGLLRTGYRAGGDVAILGGGTIGLFTAQWARILGAARVTVFDIDGARLALAKRLGADAAIDTTEPGFREEALEATGGRGFGYVYETAGADATMRLSFELAANKAGVCFIGTPARDLVLEPKLLENILRKEFTLTGSWMSYSAPFPGREWAMTARCFASGELKFDDGLIFKRLRLRDIAEGFAMYRTPGLVKGKLMIHMD